MTISNGATTVRFRSSDADCDAWFFPGAESSPFEIDGKRPVVVMAHGFAGTKDSGLGPYAQRFAEAGLAVLAFDYRGFGLSGGEPRQQISLERQADDYRAAIVAAKTQPGAGMGAYCASKAGVLMLVEVAALELADRRVRVNAVSPGLVMTPLTEGIGFVPGLTEDYLDNTPLGRSGEPAEIADTVAFLASDKARWITGAAFDVNGGAHLKRYPDVLGKVRALAGEA